MQNKANLPSRARSVPVGAWRGRERPWRTRQGQSLPSRRRGMASPQKRLTASLQTGSAVRNKPNFGGPVGTGGPIMQNKANFPPRHPGAEGPIVQNKANSRGKTRPRWPRHAATADHVKQSQFPGPRLLRRPIRLRSGQALRPPGNDRNKQRGHRAKQSQFGTAQVKANFCSGKGLR